ncbi:MAG: ABC transporter permease, partial [Chitinophagaceae bacterium]|nr:ABC transporter permease [Chitinophagaceae bacterium]
MNFIRTTVRGLQKNKGYSFLNIAGLAIGIACAALIFLWVEDEMTYDHFHEKKNLLHITKVQATMDANSFTHTSTPGVMGPAVQSEIPGIANTCRVTEGQTSLLFNAGKEPTYAAGLYVEPSFFDMFSFQFVQGNKKTAFSQRHSIVITERTAKKFFGNEADVVGKTVRVNNTQDYVVSG